MKIQLCIYLTVFQTEDGNFEQNLKKPWIFQKYWGISHGLVNFKVPTDHMFLGKVPRNGPVECNMGNVLTIILRTGFPFLFKKIDILGLKCMID